MTPDQERIARRKVRKFLARAEVALDSPVVELRETNGNGHNLAFDATFERNVEGEVRLLSMEPPTLSPRLLNSVVVDCRVFFAVQEDCYLPGVVAAFCSLIPRERARLMKPLKATVNAVVKNGKLVAPIGYSGRLETDNGLGPGKLLGDDQIAMDYIYGVALHEDEERLARLANISDMDSVRSSVLLQRNQLLHVVEIVRDQLVHDIEQGHFSVLE